MYTSGSHNFQRNSWCSSCFGYGDIGRVHFEVISRSNSYSFRIYIVVSSLLRLNVVVIVVVAVMFDCTTNIIKFNHLLRSIPAERARKMQKMSGKSATN